MNRRQFSASIPFLPVALTANYVEATETATAVILERWNNGRGDVGHNVKKCDISSFDELACAMVMRLHEGQIQPFILLHYSGPQEWHDKLMSMDEQELTQYGMKVMIDAHDIGEQEYMTRVVDGKSAVFK